MERIPWGEGHDCRAHHDLHVEGLCVSYGPVAALREISFHTGCGHRLALIGPNGAGKTTLLKALTGLAEPDHGKMWWRGRPLSGQRREFAYLPQREHVDWSFPATVRHVVEMGRYPYLGWWRRFSREDRAVTDRALEAMDLMGLQNRQINALSGGQQQRVFLARALAQEAHVLLLDEPFTGLDVPSQDSLRQLLRSLSEEGRLIIASHHDIDSVPQIFDQAMLLDRRQIAFGSVEEVCGEENLDLLFGQTSAAK